MKRYNMTITARNWNKLDDMGLPSLVFQTEYSDKKMDRLDKLMNQFLKAYTTREYTHLDIALTKVK
jgi:hypothetical protein